MELKEILWLVFLSFLASCGFGVVFRIERKLLPLAGLGGALTRVILIILQQHIDNRFLFMLLSAMFASLFAEIMAIRLKRPSTVFLYPSIIPLIPGDLFYHFIVGTLISEPERVITYGPACIAAVSGMALGFVLISTLMHYYRRWFFARLQKQRAKIIR